MRNRERKYFLFVIPGLVGMFFIYGIPYIKLIIYSFQMTVTDRYFAGAMHYKELFVNRAFKYAISNTTFVCIGGLILILPISILLALFLYKCGKIQSFIRISFILPLFVPAACVVMVWRMLFEQEGIVNNFLIKLGMNSKEWNGSVWGKLSLLIIYLWRNIGLNVVVFTGALTSVPMDCVDMARIEGAGRIKVFFMVIIRHLTPAIAFTSMMSLRNALKSFRDVYLLTGDYPSEEMYLLGHFLNNMLRQMNYPRMAAATILFTLVTAIVMYLFYFLDKHISKGNAI